MSTPCYNKYIKRKERGKRKMETVKIQFKANKKTYIIEFPWRGADNFPKDVRAIYKKYGIEKATSQMFTRPGHGWTSFKI